MICYLWLICFTIGLCFMFDKVYRIVKFIRRHMRKSDSSYDKYKSTKKDSWALVTGGSDGIGLEICK